MKHTIWNRSLLIGLISGFYFLLNSGLTAENFATLHSFAPDEGIGPYAELFQMQGRLYGTTYAGGASNQGTVFSVNTDGTGFTNLHSFNGASEGNTPLAGLTSFGDTLYGTTYGNPSRNGTVFRIQADGTGFTNVTGSGAAFDGANAPRAALVLSGNTLYGATTSIGDAMQGAVFAVQTDGSGFTNLHIFTALNSGTNGDGCAPEGALMLSGNTVYGMASHGGAFGNGTIFTITPDGSFTTLHSFAATSGTSASGGSTNEEGAIPRAALILSGGTLYGATSAGGASGSGTIFKISTNGTNFEVLHSFDVVPTPLNNPTNRDGSQPLCTLVLSGRTLYGTTSVGGPAGCGTVFAINIDGTGFTTVHSFSGGGDGISPLAGLLLLGNKLYGTANGGGDIGYGTIFSVSLPFPELISARSGTNIILAWQASATDFALQSTTNLNSGNWFPVPFSPSVVNGQNTVTNPISGAQQFFRLIR